MFNTLEECKMKRDMIESTEKWKYWCNKMPALHFKQEWNVKIIPPFGGALTRFYIEYNGNHVSVYFDPYSRLGWVYSEDDELIPYFEIYPYEDNPKRYCINNTDEMMSDIELVLNGEK